MLLTFSDTVELSSASKLPSSGSDEPALRPACTTTLHRLLPFADPVRLIRGEAQVLGPWICLCVDFTALLIEH